MDTLQDKWSPCHNVNSLLMSIQSMLTDPNCSSPANPEAAQLFIKDKAAYNRCVCGGGLWFACTGLLAPGTAGRVRSQRQLGTSHRLVLAARLCVLSVLLQCCWPCCCCVPCGSAGGCGASQQRVSRVANSCQPQQPAAAGAWAAQAQQQRQCKQRADAPTLSAASNGTGCWTVASRGVCWCVWLVVWVVVGPRPSGWRAHPSTKLNLQWLRTARGSGIVLLVRWAAHPLMAACCFSCHLGSSMCCGCGFIMPPVPFVCAFGMLL